MSTIFMANWNHAENKIYLSGWFDLTENPGMEKIILAISLTHQMILVQQNTCASLIADLIPGK